MKISTKGRYALRMLIDLAENKKDGFIALNDISKRQNISKKYLEQIVPLLNGMGVLVANRGHNGGYKLAVDPSSLTVGDILRVTEGNLAPVACIESDINTCERAGECITLPIWQGLHKVITEYLDSISVQDIIDKNEALNIDNYNI